MTSVLLPYAKIDDAMSGTRSVIADRITTFETQMRAAKKSRAPSLRISLRLQ
jgi:hypothetical protein